VIKRIIAVALSTILIAGLAIAREKDSQTEKKVEKSMDKKNPIVEIKTNLGSFYIEVFEKETPIHAGNFLTKADAHKYDSLTFHRIVAGFVIQGGDPTGTGSGSMGDDRLADEKASAPPEVRGTVAMARSQMGASNCQFYVNLRDNTGLDRQGFTSFAKVVKGMDVVDKIAAAKVGPGDKPIEPVIMLKIQRVDKIPGAAEKAKSEKPAEGTK
jgi:cyclophilin family peptidyl-prolyl cis-trans isomerase